MSDEIYYPGVSKFPHSLEPTVSFEHQRLQAEAATGWGVVERIRDAVLEWEHHDCQRTADCDEAESFEDECPQHEDGECPECSEECGRGQILTLTSRALEDRPKSSAALLAERDELREAKAQAEAEVDAAIEFVGVIRDELVKAGGKPGDREVALDNLRALIAQRDAHEAALTCLNSDYGTHRCVRCDSEVTP